MNRENYLSELSAHLHCRGVEDHQIGEIIAEVETHLEDSGEAPEDAFGPAENYAEQRTVFAEKESGKQLRAPWHNRTFRATAFDEIETLKWAGAHGWELIDVGPLALNCRRPIDLTQAFGWEYIRRTGTNVQAITLEMAESNWLPCGRWIVFHYFKRNKGLLGS